MFERQPQGLYRPEFEKDSCGFGLIAHMDDQPSHKLVQTAITALQRMTHRGAVAADGKTGDGCGLLMKKPDTFLRREAERQGIVLSAEDYGVGNLFLVFLAGIFIGTISGLVGVGGGVVMVPLMVLGMGLTTKKAVSTSLAVVMFTGIVGAAGYVATGFRNVQDLLSLPPLIIGSIIGAPLGVRIRDWLPENVVRIGFGVFMVIVALRLFGEALGIF